MHNSNTKKNAQIHLFHLNMVFSKEAKIWIVQNYSSDKELTQLRRDYIINFTITKNKTVPLSRV